MGLWKAFIGMMIYILVLHSFDLIHGDNLTVGEWILLIAVMIVGVFSNEGGK